MIENLSEEEYRMKTNNKDYLTFESDILCEMRACLVCEHYDTTPSVVVKPDKALCHSGKGEHGWYIIPKCAVIKDPPCVDFKAQQDLKPLVFFNPETREEVCL
jgi:hypothetical protein